MTDVNQRLLEDTWTRTFPDEVSCQAAMKEPCNDHCAMRARDRFLQNSDLVALWEANPGLNYEVDVVGHGQCFFGSGEPSPDPVEYHVFVGPPIGLNFQEAPKDVVAPYSQNIRVPGLQKTTPTPPHFFTFHSLDLRPLSPEEIRTIGVGATTAGVTALLVKILDDLLSLAGCRMLILTPMPNANGVGVSCSLEHSRRAPEELACRRMTKKRELVCSVPGAGTMVLRRRS
jgi:hypothetical protein